LDDLKCEGGVMKCMLQFDWSAAEDAIFGDASALEFCSRGVYNLEHVQDSVPTVLEDGRTSASFL